MTTPPTDRQIAERIAIRIADLVTAEDWFGECVDEIERALAAKEGQTVERMARWHEKHAAALNGQASTIRPVHMGDYDIRPLLHAKAEEHLRYAEIVRAVAPPSPADTTSERNER